MIYMKLKIYIVLLLSLFLYCNCFAFEEKKVIRVGISNQNFSSQVFKNATFISNAEIRIIDMAQNVSIANVEANKQLNVALQDGNLMLSVANGKSYENLQGPLLLSSNETIGIVDLNRKGTPAKYRGMIEIKIAPNTQGFNIINIIDIENYLRGVVPNEMPITFGLEALKAQAVAARNYATNASISPNYDVTDSTASQVYYGANSYKDITDKAIMETIGIYALYDNKPISALYFSTSVGITDDWDDVFAQNNEGLHPYLKARYDNPKQKPLTTEKDVIEFLSKKDTGFDTISPKFRWEFTFTRQELEETLHNTLQQQSKAGLVSPKYDGDIKLEGLKEIKPIKRTQSGKVVELLISSNSGDYKVKKELGIRRVLKKGNAILPSANFYIETPNVTENKVLGIFDFSETYPETYVIKGGGFGHGVGMSQFGAYALAKAGKKYPEILHHYYTDIILSTIPKDVHYNDYNYWYKTDFYFDKNIFKSAYLYIDNKNRCQEFNFKINELDFLDTPQYAHNKVMKIDITQYLKGGMNSVDFAPLTIKDKGKAVSYRIEFVENGSR